MSDKEDIEKLKEVALSANYDDVRKKTIDTLEVYGKEAIPAITEIVQQAEYDDVKKHGLEAIKRIKKSSQS